MRTQERPLNYKVIPITPQIDNKTNKLYIELIVSEQRTSIDEDYLNIETNTKISKNFKTIRSDIDNLNTLFISLIIQLEITFSTGHM